MVKFKEKTVSLDIEKQIIIGLIVSTSFFSKVRRMIRYEYFKVEYLKQIVIWCLTYFDKYEEAPTKQIQSIFEIEKHNLKDESESELIQNLLERLSIEYEDSTGINVDYLVDVAREYFNTRSLEVLFSEGKKLIDAGRMDDAIELLENRKKISKNTSERFKFFDEDELNEFDPDNTENKLFRMPGAIGNLFGDFYRGYLMAVTAPEKRGKTHTLEEIAFHALMNKRIVVWYSLEMNKYQMKNRVSRRLTGCANEDIENLKIPVFDCQWNQTGACDRKQRKNKESISKTIIDGKPIKPEFNKDNKYRPCTWCRDNPTDALLTSSSYEFKVDSWFINQSKVSKLTKEILNKKAKGFVKNFGNRLHLRSFPAFGASPKDMKDDLMDLIYTEEVFPDVIIIDYFDIMQEDSRGYSERDSINTIWMMGKNIADTFNALVITADQSNKLSRKMESLDDSVTTEDKRKDANLDIRIGLNQTDEEKELGRMRYNVLFHRHRYFNKKREVMVLQELETCQPLLDSELLAFEPNKKKKKNK